MLNYSIHFRTVDDFRNYANMICRFSIGGYVHQGGFKENMYALLEIMGHCPLEHLTLTLTKYEEKDIPALEAYLLRTGLMNRKEVQAA